MSEDSRVGAFQNIPKELRDLKQWVVADSRNKIPCNPVSRTYAKINDPKSWGTFLEAVHVINSSKQFDSVGFVLTAQDPYTIIDLDHAVEKPSNVQTAILDALSFSYIEKSVSEDGYHIIVKARAVAGRRKQNVEVYNYNRYVILTGNTINDKPIAPAQEIIDEILISMGVQDKTFITIELEDDIIPLSEDDNIIKEARSKYGDRFTNLYEGDWRIYFTSQSEADLTLVNILCQLTDNNSQVARIFKRSELGKRAKASRKDYLIRTINAARMYLVQNKGLYTSTFDEVRVSMAEIIKQEGVEVYKDIPPLPNGIIKDLVTYFMQISIRPVYEISLVSALGFFAGLVGRSYNISNTGLNIYLLLLAPTGTGKEQISANIDAIVDKLTDHSPFVNAIIGPKAFASGQALLRSLSEKQSMVCVLGEFGYTLQQMSDSKAQAYQIAFKKALLDVYQKSGEGRKLQATEYVDVKNKIESVLSPNLTIIGEGTPETFFDGLDDNMVADGLLPRFTIVDYKGDRPPRNKNVNEARLPEETLKHLLYLVDVYMQNKVSNKARQIEIDDEAQELLDKFDELCDDKIRGSVEMTRQLWNRAHLKALKYASLLAISLNGASPKIMLEHVEWAIAFIENEIINILNKFKKGELGAENKYLFVIKQIFSEYSDATVEKRLRLTASFRLAQQGTVIPQAYILQRMRVNKVIKRDGISHTMMRILLDELVEQKILKELSDREALELFDYKGVVYSMGENYL